MPAPCCWSYICLLCENPLDWNPKFMTGICLSFFLADCKSRVYSRGANRKCRCGLWCMKKEEVFCYLKKKKVYYQFILNNSLLSYLYNCNPTCLGLDLMYWQTVLPVLQMPGSSFCQHIPVTCTGTGGFSLLSPCSLSPPGNPKKSTVSSEVRTEKHPLKIQWSTQAAGGAGHCQCWMLALASFSKNITVMQ